ncbi:ethanolamine ammonia-lyase subunit EutC [Methylomonas sp. AM2-LC]|uniref:ethanolamine ammonia-lyase subunit EutC n=1 Tax=Methylomonas sp. AM2-LC TaxID=3153301 RepID=UPI003264674D
MMHDPWFNLRDFTQARIAQGRVGSGIPSQALLDFQIAHAAARDAVHQAWDMDDFARQVKSLNLHPLCLRTSVNNRVEYLQRPDKGRCLHAESRQVLLASAHPEVDVLLIFSNGLSSTAIHSHGFALLKAIYTVFQESAFSLGPICLLPDARVAVADEIGALLNARLTIMIIGERPGLSAADSLGAYLTLKPRVGNTDAERNCLSNIRPPEGLSYTLAASKLCYLANAALQCGYSGVALKDGMHIPIMHSFTLE